MAGNDDFIRSMQIFQQGVRDLAVQRAITGANEQVQQIKLHEADEATQLQGLRNVANNLTMQLAGMGAPAETIKQLDEAVAGPRPSPIQTPFQGLISGLRPGDPKVREISQKYIDEGYENKALLQRVKSQEKENDEGRKSYLKNLEQFKNHKAIREEIAGLATLNQLPDELGKNNLNYVFGLKGLIKKVESRISNEDFALATPNKDLWSRAMRVKEAVSSGKPIPQDVEAVELLAGVLKRKSEENIDLFAKGFAKSRAKKIKGATPEALYEDLITENLPNKVFGNQSAPKAAGATPVAPPAGAGGLRSLLIPRGPGPK